MDQISVLIADDHELVRYAMRTLLEAEPGMVVVGEAGDSASAIAGCIGHCPDVLLLDLRMPGVGGVEVCREVRASCPETAVLVLTSFDEDDEVMSVLSAGASGYILKDTRPENVVQAIRTIADGQSVFDTSVANRIISSRTPSANGAARDPESLSEREMEVLELMAKGHSNREIGVALSISETTVKTHVSHILRKLDVVDRTQAVLLAVRSGLVGLGN